MARLARLVLPELPHHVIQRGVRSMALFATDADRQLYLRLLAQFCQREGVTAWAWAARIVWVETIGPRGSVY